ncbi:MAG: hypothetical protein IM475_19665 [Microcystis sp. M061S2]|nr:hypothetical protein [Microcystis sp. M061S2]
MEEGVTMGTKMNWQKAAQKQRAKDGTPFEVKEKMTPQQRITMRSLGIRYHKFMDRRLAADLIIQKQRMIERSRKEEKPKTLLNLLQIFVANYKLKADSLKPEEVAAIRELIEFVRDDLSDLPLNEIKVNEWQYSPFKID